jgi:hypothetical protein
MFGFLFFLFFTPLPANAAIALQNGDVLLQSVPCYLCAMIEAEEKGPYSHAGVVDVDAVGVETVYEAWTQVENIPLADFIAKRKSNSKTLVLRPIDPQGHEIKINETDLARAYQTGFAGHDYDEQFLWFNTDAKGEKYYCSELVAKLLNYFLPVPMPTKPMHFKMYRSLWISYFGGTPPDGQPGISPPDFARSPLFKKMGEI